MRFTSLHIAILISVLFIHCDTNSSFSYNSNKESNNSNTISGVYTYSEQGGSINITILDNSWYCEARFPPTAPAIHTNGFVREKYLYEESGTVKVGRISGSRIYFDVYGQTVVLSKKD